MSLKFYRYCGVWQVRLEISWVTLVLRLFKVSGVSLHDLGWPGGHAQIMIGRGRRSHRRSFGLSVGVGWVFGFSGLVLFAAPTVRDTAGEVTA